MAQSVAEMSLGTYGRQRHWSAPKINEIAVTAPFSSVGISQKRGLFSLSAGTHQDVRYGSSADIGARSNNVRFTPESGHRSARS
jgi:hypothetical protein